MKKILLAIVAVSLLFLASCDRNTASDSSNSIDDNKTSIENVSPIPVEVPKIPTSEARSDGPECVYPEKQVNSNISPEIYKNHYDVISLKNISAKKTADILGRFFPECSFSEGERGSRLLIKGKQEDISEASKFIKLIDNPLPQISIESKIMEISESSLKNLGIVWGNTAGSFKISVDNNGGVSGNDLSATISALASNGDAHLIANPHISTLDNTEAVVNIGSKIPYAVPVSTASTSTQWAVQYIDAGVTLKITPRLGEDGTITASIHPEVSSVSEWRTTPAGEFPVISTRNADAVVHVKDGETIIIGGLIDEADRENVLKIPLAGDIPIIKELFTKRTKEKTRTEVVFMITPHVNKL